MLATVAMETITNLRGKKAELQEKMAYLKAAIKILGGKSNMLEMFSTPDPDTIEEYRKAERRLAEVEEELELVQSKIASPEQSLAYLEAILKNPNNTLAMERHIFRLNWRGYGLMVCRIVREMT